MSRRMYSKGQLIKIIQEQGGGGAVASVNGKTGIVVLKAEDINVNNSTSVQANLERIDLEVEGLIDDVADKLDKVTTAGDRERVYGIASNGTQETIDVAIYTAGGALCKRDSSGKVMVATPTESSHAANKGYVDQAISENKWYKHLVTIWDEITGNIKLSIMSTNPVQLTAMSEVAALIESGANYTIVDDHTNSKHYFKLILDLAGTNFGRILYYDNVNLQYSNTGTTFAFVSDVVS